MSDGSVRHVFPPVLIVPLMDRRRLNFDGEFKAVTKLRAQIDRRCLYATAGDERSLCVDKGIEINRKVKGLRARRAKAASAVERYDRMIAWCASYKNWFC